MAWTGSWGWGLSFCCRNMEAPMIIGHTPMLMTSGTKTVGSQGISPNRFHTEVGSAADRS